MVHTWLEYSRNCESAYCFACRHLSLPNTPETPFTAQGGYSNWKKAMYKDGGFKWHEKSEGHVNAMFAWSEYKKKYSHRFFYTRCFGPSLQKKVEENRTYIKTIAGVLRLTAMQNIAQRGHIKTEGSQNKGNFLELIELIARHSPLIAKKKKKKNASGSAKYLSNTFLNEILECLSDMESEVFSVIADETKDLKKSEQLSLVLRCYYNGAVHESFLDFQRASELDAAGLSQKIIQCLERYGLDYKSNLVGQGYDGATVMSGRCSGVAAWIKAEARHAFYVHCNAHCPHVENSGERSVEAWGLLVQIDLTFIATLAVFRQILGDAKCAPDMLQAPSLDLTKAVDVIHALQETLEDCRAGSCFDDLWQQTVETAKKCDVAVEAVEKRTQRGTSRLSEYLVESTVGQRRCKEGDKDKFRIGLFYPILDRLHAELQRRFSKNNCDIMKGMHALNPKDISFLEEKTVLRLGCLFDCDVEDLKHELYQIKKVIQRKAQCGTELSSILDFTSFLEPYKEGFHQFFHLCRIAIALPVSSASCERSFSTLKLIKNHLRTTINDDRLSSIGLLSIERRRARSLNLDAFVERFTHRHQNRRIQLS
uniref:TTF-type domain-containing protein n=1 Tax=Myripristis murdjan TaxID=586833 RepID=A0A667Z4Q8_9TELE